MNCKIDIRPIDSLPNLPTYDTMSPIFGTGSSRGFSDATELAYSCSGCLIPLWIRHITFWVALDVEPINPIVPDGSQSESVKYNHSSKLRAEKAAMVELYGTGLLSTSILQQLQLQQP